MRDWVELFLKRRPVPATPAKGSQECSLCEVLLSADEHSALCRWPVTVKPAHLQACLRPTAYNDENLIAAGLCLLWFATLHGREQAAGGEIWPPVAAAFPEACRDVLFQAGHPKMHVKAALQSTCRELQIRHAFGRHGGQAYYLTVHLQFGFSRQSLSQLPLWISGHPLPTAVAALLRDSPRFQELWAALKAGQAPMDNPFWPPNATMDSCGVSGAFKLRWSNGRVEFRARISEIFPGLEDGCYDLFPSQEWIMVSDGRSDLEWVSVEPQRSGQVLTLVALGSDQPRQFEVCLWDADISISAWNKEGELLRNLRQLKVGGTIRLPDQWSIESPCIQIFGNFFQVEQFPLVIRDEQGNIVEDFDIGQPSSPNQLAAVTLRWFTEVDCLPMSIEGTLLNLPPDAKVREAEICRGPLGDVVTCEVPPSIQAPSWAVTVHWQGRQRRVRAALPKFKLITWNRGLFVSKNKPSLDDWTMFKDQGAVDLGWLKLCAFRFLGDFSDYGLLEGNRFLGRPAVGTSSLGGLSGYGAPIRLRRGPFNPNFEKDRVLVSSLVNQGIVSQIVLEGERFHIGLRSQLYPGEEHFLLFWDGHTVHRQSLALEGTLPFPDVMLIAIGFRGSWLGGQWFRGKPPASPKNISLAAHLLRWGRAPLMQFQYRSLVQGWMNGHTLQFCRAWFESEFELHTDNKTGMAPWRLRHWEDEGWYDVLREFFGPTMAFPKEDAPQILACADWSAWTRVHPGTLDRLLRLAGRREAKIILQLLQADVSDQAEQEMGVDAYWLANVIADYFNRKNGNEDLKVALAFPSFQRRLLLELLQSW